MLACATIAPAAGQSLPPTSLWAPAYILYAHPLRGKPKCLRPRPGALHKSIRAPGLPPKSSFGSINRSPLCTHPHPTDLPSNYGVKAAIIKHPLTPEACGLTIARTNTRAVKLTANDDILAAQDDREAGYVHPPAEPGDALPTVREAKTDRIIEHFLTHPHHTVPMAADTLQVPQRWLYNMVNSDLFKARLASYRDQMKEMVIETLGEQMTGTLALGLERLAEHLEKTTDPDYILEAVDILSKRHVEVHVGGQRGALQRSPETTFQQNNVFISDPAELGRIKELAFKAANNLRDKALEAAAQ